ncbi:MAG: DUF2259 domain-containing protein [Alkalilacustris sp.]
MATRNAGGFLRRWPWDGGADRTRRAALSVWLLLAAGGAVAAGDHTHDRILGFSEDGRHFAFETFGLQRGSGLPFANIFVVDLERDAWVPGTPFRARAGEAAMAEVEAAPYAALAAIRAEAQTAAEELLEALAIRRPATVLFARGIAEAHGASAQITVARPHPDDPTAPPQAVTTLALDEVPVPGGAAVCPDPAALRGYRLSHLPAGAAPRILHEDARIPASRGCPVAYRLDAVVSAGHPRPGGRGVALISVWRHGFEGLERHVIAVPVPLPGPSSDGPEDVAGIAAAFLGEAAPVDVGTLQAALRATLPGQGTTPSWPDADLSPAVRAALIVQVVEPPLPRARLWITTAQRTVPTEGAGGPVPLSLVSVVRHDLGRARRAELAEPFGVVWRFAMRPVQGMRADAVAAGRGTTEASACGPVPCAAPGPARLEGARTPAPGAAGPRFAAGAAGPGFAAGAAGLPSDADLIALLEAAGAADAFLIERGLGQDGAVQVVAVARGMPVRGLVATAEGIVWLHAPVLGSPDGDVTEVRR